MNFLDGELFLSEPGGCDHPPSSEFGRWAGRICKGERHTQVRPIVGAPPSLQKSWCLFKTKKMCDSLYYRTRASLLYRVNVWPRWSLSYTGRAESLWQRPYGLKILKYWLAGPLQKMAHTGGTWRRYKKNKHDITSWFVAVSSDGKKREKFL